MRFCLPLMAPPHLGLERAKAILEIEIYLVRTALSRAAVWRRSTCTNPAAEVPVQVPTKFEMTVNIKAANALARVVPPGPVAADEIIE